MNPLLVTADTRPNIARYYTRCHLLHSLEAFRQINLITLSLEA
jgi:hypothetical protein